jgi:hypothetical protein
VPPALCNRSCHSLPGNSLGGGGGGGGGGLALSGRDIARGVNKRQKRRRAARNNSIKFREGKGQEGASPAYEQLNVTAANGAEGDGRGWTHSRTSDILGTIQ